MGRDAATGQGCAQPGGGAFRERAAPAAGSTCGSWCSLAPRRWDDSRRRGDARIAMFGGTALSRTTSRRRSAAGGERRGCAPPSTTPTTSPGSAASCTTSSASTCRPSGGGRLLAVTELVTNSLLHAGRDRSRCGRGSTPTGCAWRSTTPAGDPPGPRVDDPRRGNGRRRPRAALVRMIADRCGHRALPLGDGLVRDGPGPRTGTAGTRPAAPFRSGLPRPPGGAGRRHGDGDDHDVVEVVAGGLVEPPPVPRLTGC